MASLKERVVDILLSRQLVTKEQLDEALTIQQRQGGSVQNILVDSGLVKETDLFSAISQGLGIPLISLSRFKIDPALKGLISRELATQYQLMPVSCIGQTLTVAMADPLNVFALDTLTTMTGLSINSLLTTPNDLREAIDLYYGAGVEETLREMAQKAETDAIQLVKEAKAEESDEAALLSLTQEAPVVKLTDALLGRAVRLRASDILIEPMEKQVRVRYRVDGMFQEGQPPPKHLQSAVVSRIKIMSELNIAEHRLPQDGHCAIQVEQRIIDFRVSIVPTIFGEKVALRVLDKGVVRLNIDQFGFNPEDLARLKACAQKPHGLILATGPTGSGKTTTLYALLTLIDRPNKNIVTVEDPVEFELEGINQVSARPDIGLTFAAALRSILRQDPDVIMVGEIRDSETADMSVKSALTGHLVLSTLHTNTAAGTIVRLINMGLDPFLINSCLTAVIGQRLVRKICRYCTELYQPAQGIATKLDLVDQKGQPLSLARGAGCQRCLQSGYAGRELLAEVLVMTPEIRALVLKRAPEKEIEAAARKVGMKPIREHGLEKVVAHVTTLEEVFRTTTGEVVG